MAGTLRSRCARAPSARSRRPGPPWRASGCASSTRRWSAPTRRTSVGMIHRARHLLEVGASRETATENETSEKPDEAAPSQAGSRLEDQEDPGRPRGERAAGQDRRPRHQGPEGTWPGAARVRGRADAVAAAAPQAQGLQEPQQGVLRPDQRRAAQPVRRRHRGHPRGAARRRAGQAPRSGQGARRGRDRPRPDRHAPTPSAWAPSRRSSRPEAPPRSSTPQPRRRPSSRHADRPPVAATPDH